MRSKIRAMGKDIVSQIECARIHSYRAEAIGLLSGLQAHLGDKIRGGKIQPKVGKHKVREVQNHKVLDPHRKSAKSTARPDPPPPPRPRSKKK